MLSIQALDHPDTGDVLVVFAIDHGDGPPDAHEGVPSEALPISQDERERRDNAQADQSQVPVGDQHGDDNTRQAEEVRQGGHEQLEGLLQLQDVALTA